MNMPVMMVYNAGSYSGAANYKVSTTSANTMFPLIFGMNLTGIYSEIVEIGKYSIFEIANWFLNKEPMSLFKLQKLCYYAQAWNYTLRDSRLIDSDFQAWVHGPMSPALYEKFKNFGFDNIKIKGHYKSTIDESGAKSQNKVFCKKTNG